MNHALFQEIPFNSTVSSPTDVEYGIRLDNVQLKYELEGIWGTQADFVAPYIGKVMAFICRFRAHKGPNRVIGRINGTAIKIDRYFPGRGPDREFGAANGGQKFGKKRA